MKNVHCILHIGAEKTGTSSVQHYLNRYREEYRRLGVIYLDLPVSNTGSQIEFAGATCKKNGRLLYINERLGLKNDVDKARLRSLLSKEIRRQLATAEQLKRTLIISCEHFHSRMIDEESVRALKDFLGPYASSFSVLMYVRHQVEMAASYYSTRIKTGEFGVVPLPRNLEQDLWLSSYFDFKMLYDRWASVFGGDALICKLYDTGLLADNDIVSDFCRTLALPMLARSLTFRVNESINIAGLAHLERSNALLHLFRGVAPIFVREVREYSIRLLRYKHAGRSALFSRQEAIEFGSKFSKSNAALSKVLKHDERKKFLNPEYLEYPASLNWEDVRPGYWSSVFFLLRSVFGYCREEQFVRMKIKRISCLFIGYIKGFG